MADCIIEVRPRRGGWEVFEMEGVAPRYPDRRHALDYARFRLRARAGEIRVRDKTGALAETIVGPCPDPALTG